MPAFTQLCQKVNISIFDDTITVYPKMDPTSPKVFFYPGYYNEVVELFDLHMDELKNKDYVHREDNGHDRYHEDHFFKR